MSEVPDTSRWLTRNEAIDMLGVAHQTLLNYEQRGDLHPQYAMRSDARGISQRRMIVYDPAELVKLAAKINGKRGMSPHGPGEVAARAFEMFCVGATQQQIVIETRAEPDTIRGLHDKWLEMGGEDLVINPLAKEALEAVVGSFKKIAELVTAVEKIGAELHLLKSKTEDLAP